MTDNNDDEWNKKYAELLVLNLEYGQAVRLMNTYSEYNLRKWLAFQVANLNPNVVSDKAKLDKLAAIGYLVRDTNSLPTRRDIMWETRYGELEEFHKLHKHCRVPKSTNKQLHGWLDTQKTYYRSKPETFPIERKNKLLKLGFDFGSSSNGGGNSLVTKPKITFSKNIRFQIVFNSTRLGLILKEEGTRVVVKEVQNTAYKDKIQRGDIISSIGNKSVLGMPLKQIIKILAESKRPVTVGFERTVESIGNGKTLPQPRPQSNLARPTIGPGLPNSAAFPLPRERNKTAPHLNSVALDPNKGQRKPEPAREGHQNPLDRKRLGEKNDEIRQQPRSNSISSTIDKENRDVAVRPSTTLEKFIRAKGDAMIPKEKPSSQKPRSTNGISKEQRQALASKPTKRVIPRHEDVILGKGFGDSEGNKTFAKMVELKKDEFQNLEITSEKDKVIVEELYQAHRRSGRFLERIKINQKTFLWREVHKDRAMKYIKGLLRRKKKATNPASNSRMFDNSNGNENKQPVGVGQQSKVENAKLLKVQTMASGEEGENEGIWDLIRVIPATEEKVECRHDDCCNRAVAVWATDEHSEDEWPLCEEHQLEEFGGWPEGVEPVEASNPNEGQQEDLSSENSKLHGKSNGWPSARGNEAAQKGMNSPSNDGENSTKRRSSSVWETLSDDYRDFLSNICSQEEFEAASFAERDEIFQRYKRRREKRNEPSRDLKRRKITREEVDNEYGDPYLMALKMMVLQLEDESNELLKLQQQRRNKILRSFAATARISNIDSNSRAIVENDPHLSSMAQTVQLLQKEKERVLRQQKQRKKFLVWAKEIVKHCQEDEDKEGPVNETLFL